MAWESTWVREFNRRARGSRGPKSGEEGGVEYSGGGLEFVRAGEDVVLSLRRGVSCYVFAHSLEYRGWERGQRGVGSDRLEYVRAGGVRCSLFSHP